MSSEEWGGATTSWWAQRPLPRGNLIIQNCTFLIIFVEYCNSNKPPSSQKLPRGNLGTRPLKTQVGSTPVPTPNRKGENQGWGGATSCCWGRYIPEENILDIFAQRRKILWKNVAPYWPVMSAKTLRTGGTEPPIIRQGWSLITESIWKRENDKMPW